MGSVGTGTIASDLMYSNRVGGDAMMTVVVCAVSVGKIGSPGRYPQAFADVNFSTGSIVGSLCETGAAHWL